MSTPIMYAITPFDATQAFTFKFKYSGNQAMSNTLLIVNNETSAQVYKQTVLSMRLEHTLPKNTLKNGVTYAAQIQVKDSAGQLTVFSTPIVFTCFSTPTFKFSNLINGQVIENAIFEAQLTYSQTEGEQLNSYYVSLYDVNHQIIYQSTQQYDTSSLVHLLDGLENGRSYYLKAYGQTIGGMEIATTDVQFTVEYLQPNAFSVVQVENNHLAGTITIKSNLILVDGKYDGQPVYIDGNKINLMTNNNRPLVFDEGFAIKPDFSLQLKMTNFNTGVNILEMENGSVVLTVCQGNIYSEYKGKYFIQLTATSGLYTYTIKSGYFSTKNVMINLRRQSNLFMLDVVEVSR